MLALANLKREMEFARDLEGIVNTFKMAALIQFRQFQKEGKFQPAFRKEIETGLMLLPEQVLSASSWVKEESSAPTAVSPSAIVAITSDLGFLGGLNSSVLNAALQQRKSTQDTLIVVGERGARGLEARKEKFVFFPGIDENIHFKGVEKLRNYFLREYGEKFRQVLIVYPDFVSLTLQRVNSATLLPYLLPEKQKRPAIWAGEHNLLEPSGNEVLLSLVNLGLGLKLLEIFASAKLSEYAARIMHLESSLETLTQLKKKFTFAYFQQIHAQRDKTIREISAAKILFKNRAKAEGLSVR